MHSNRSLSLEFGKSGTYYYTDVVNSINRKYRVGSNNINKRHGNQNCMLCGPQEWVGLFCLRLIENYLKPRVSNVNVCVTCVVFFLKCR